MGTSNMDPQLRTFLLWTDVSRCDSSFWRYGNLNKCQSSCQKAKSKDAYLSRIVYQSKFNLTQQSSFFLFIFSRMILLYYKYLIYIKVDRHNYENYGYECTSLVRNRFVLFFKFYQMVYCIHFCIIQISDSLQTTTLPYI